MDVVNRAWGQFNELFRSMTPGARMTAALLLAVVVISLAYLFNHNLSGGDDYLLGGQRFSAGELSAIEAAFGKAGLGDHKVEGGQVRIPSGQKAQYLGALADAGAMPAQFSTYLTEAITKPGPFTSRSQQEAMLKVAWQKELAAIIGSMQGIERAAVMYNTQKKSGLRQESVTTASVSVKPMGNLALDGNQVPKIRHLVGSAIGVSPDQVTVIDLNGQTYGGGMSAGLPGASDDPYLERKRHYQADYDSRIRDALAYVPGVMVTTDVELEKQLHHLEERNHIDAKPVPVSIREETSSESSDSAGPSGRPGLEAQQRPNAPAQLGASGKSLRTEQERTSRQEQTIPSTERTTTEMAPLTPKVVLVAVAVPSSYYLKIWRDRNQTPAGQAPAEPDKKAIDQIEVEEKAKIQSHVAGVIPQPDAASDNRPLVTVTTFTHLESAELPEPAATEQAMAWLGSHWSTLSLTALALVSLVMLRSMVRSGPVMPESPPMSLPIPDQQQQRAPESGTSGGAAGGPTAAKSKNRLKRRLGSGQSLREELVEIVREDPDAAANILRGWIGKAS